MKLLIKLSAIITALALLIVTAGCSDSYQDAVIYFEIPEKPFTFDPQTASSDSELAVTANIYEGCFVKTPAELLYAVWRQISQNRALPIPLH